MMSRAVILALFAVVASAVPTFKVGSKSFAAEEDALFQRFKNEYSRTYFDEHDEAYRQGIFVSNLNMIRAHNAGDHSYSMGMNEFGDLTFEEFHATHTGFAGIRNRFLRAQNTEDLSGVETVDSVDWVAKGAVTAVKNQGQCGSCWAFSSTGAIEGAWFLSKGDLTPLSEQQLMDCSKAEGNQSCQGGLMDQAFEWVIKNGGICTEDSYPYKEHNDLFCKKSCSSSASITSYKDVAQDSADAFQAALTKQPLAIAIEADQQAFQFYKDGVFADKCGTQLDHGVLAVGFGTMDGKNYWKVKNSWGATWGDEGYILLSRDVTQTGGQCGLYLSASYPTV